MNETVMSDAAADKIRCDACPVMCYIADGRVGACDRYANHGGVLVRLDPLTVLHSGATAVPFLDGAPEDWDGDVIKGNRPFVTAVGAGTTYPDYKPAPFIVSQKVQGVDMVTVVTEGIFSYCGVKVKIDTDRHIGAERALVRVDGEAIGHVMTGEYGSVMLSLGGVLHLTGGSKKEGRVTCDALMRLCNREAVEVTIDEGATIVLQAGQAPIINGVAEKLMRVGCGSATIGMFAKQWIGSVDEVVVVPPSATKSPAAPSRNGAAMQIVAMPEITGSHMSSLSSRSTSHDDFTRPNDRRKVPIPSVLLRTRSNGPDQIPGASLANVSHLPGSPDR
jgi:hypothetical protein